MIESRYVIFQSIPGWETTFGSGIEIQHRRPKGTPFLGDQLVELDSRGNSGMRQQVPTTPGRAYRLTFAYSPRPGVPPESNGIEAYFNNELVISITASGIGLPDTSWIVFTNTVIAATSSSSLEFRAIGVSNTVGGYIDDVRLEPLAGPTLGIRCSSADCSEIVICWNTYSNAVYRVQYGSELLPNSWIDLGSQVLGDGTTKCVRDAVGPSQPRKFYRVIVE
jgi:hypothetical protein